jgi:hypothetical protein
MTKSCETSCKQVAQDMSPVSVFLSILSLILPPSYFTSPLLGLSFTFIYLFYFSRPYTSQTQYHISPFMPYPPILHSTSIISILLQSPSVCDLQPLHLFINPLVFYMPFEHSYYNDRQRTSRTTHTNLNLPYHLYHPILSTRICFHSLVTLLSRRDICLSLWYP